MKYYRYTDESNTYGTIIYVYDEIKPELRIVFAVGRWKIYTKGHIMNHKREIAGHLKYAKEITEKEALAWCI